MHLKSWILLPALLGAPAAQAESLDAQCARVHAIVVDWRAKPHAAPIKLVLGATVHEAARFPGEHWIFLDAAPGDEASPLPHVTVNFNIWSQLKKVAEAVKGSVDIIYFDHSVVKFTDWNVHHQELLALMLSPRGTLYFPLERTAMAYTEHVPIGSDHGNPAAIADLCLITPGHDLVDGFLAPYGLTRETEDVQKQVDAILVERTRARNRAALLRTFRHVVPVTVTTPFNNQYGKPGDNTMACLACDNLPAGTDEAKSADGSAPAAP